MGRGRLWGLELRGLETATEQKDMLAFGSRRAEERLRCTVLDAELRTEGFGAQGEVTAGDLRCTNNLTQGLELGGCERIDRIHGEDTPREGGFGERVGRIEVAIGGGVLQAGRPLRCFGRAPSSSAQRGARGGRHEAVRCS